MKDDKGWFSKIFEILYIAYAVFVTVNTDNVIQNSNL